MLNLEDKSLLEKYGYRPPAKKVELTPYKEDSVGKNASTSAEAKVLRKIINYYLNKLELPLMKDSVGCMEVFRQSTIGDSLVLVELTERMPYSIVALFKSNSSMRTALLRLGWFEFLNCPDHFAGTLFEALFSIADFLGRVDVKLRLLNALIGEVGYLEGRLSVSDFYIES